MTRIIIKDVFTSKTKKNITGHRSIPCMDTHRGMFWDVEEIRKTSKNAINELISYINYPGNTGNQSVGWNPHSRALALSFCQTTGWFLNHLNGCSCCLFDFFTLALCIDCYSLFPNISNKVFNHNTAALTASNILLYPEHLHICFMFFLRNESLL